MCWTGYHFPTIGVPCCLTCRVTPTAGWHPNGCICPRTNLAAFSHLGSSQGNKALSINLPTFPGEPEADQESVKVPRTATTELGGLCQLVGVAFWTLILAHQQVDREGVRRHMEDMRENYTVPCLFVFVRPKPEAIKERSTELGNASSCRFVVHVSSTSFFSLTFSISESLLPFVLTSPGVHIDRHTSRHKH